MLVRWLGAFRGCGQGLEESLKAELRGSVRREVAAEPLIKIGKNRFQSRVPGLVGLVVKRQAVIKSFVGDVWSEPDPHTGKLIPTRPAATETQWGEANHREAFVLPEFRAIMVKLPGKCKPETLRLLDAVADEFSLPRLVMHKTGFIQEVKRFMK